MTVWDCDCLKLELACQIIKTVKSCENLPRLFKSELWIPVSVFPA